MGDLTRKQSSLPVQIVGRDETKCPDVVTASGLDRLAVTGDAGTPGDAPGCAVFSSKFRVVFSEDDVSIDDSFQTLFTYSGSGKLIGSVFEFSNVGVQIKLTIDSEVIFDFKLQDIKDLQMPLGSGGALPAVPGSLEYQNAQSKLLFMPVCPIKFTTNVKFEAIRLAAPNKTMLRSAVTLTKET